MGSESYGKLARQDPERSHGTLGPLPLPRYFAQIFDKNLATLHLVTYENQIAPTKSF